MKLISFDCYGTLIDWETGILGALKPILAAHGRELPDNRILQDYARIESTIQRGPYQSYREILRGVTRQFAVELQFSPNRDDLDALPASLAGWNPFPDTLAALQALKTRYQLAVLSNIDDDLFAASAWQLGIDFDFIITAQQLQSYKPAPGNFAALLQRTGLAPSQILHAAESIYHDIIPARRLGLATVWVHRRNHATISLTGPPEGEARPDFEVPDLRTLVDQLRLRTPDPEPENRAVMEDG